ncbi:Uma2 family endonuclease [Nodosilinea sp. PGN35]|uniref:Uma2 family endonuclease n=1 Tax=Nodosilinea sp. PGN35 TaxID=3020489 RepID=UPI0023B24DA9|nr:Uma2 family endonuclease [Nodosilinea sp. TSF1-S3]MDF0370002.1 Uma2 family endonuclease [Nodosilinea sp. TSF1-S3]
MTLTTDDRRLTTVTLYRWTVDRYHQAVKAGIFEGQPLELLNGALIEMSPEGIPHAGLSSDAADYLRSRLGSQVKVREAKPITLPNDSEPEPDIAIVKPLGDLYKTERHPLVPDIFWVMEYANTSLEKDLELKDKIYAQAGITEYWVVNLKTRELVVFRDPAEGEYQTKFILTGGTIYSESFPTVALEVTKLVQ